MLHSIVFCALATALAPNATAPTASPQNGDTPPPGLLMMKGNRSAKIGTAVKGAEELLRQPQNRGMRHVIAGETPLHTAKVDDYFLCVTELTNEQYHAFVQATGHRPPQRWGEEAIAVARAAFVRAEGERAKAAREAGEKYTRETFDAAAWWGKNWQDSKWALPEELDDHPVVYVDYYDIAAYCRWAGLRPMTEFEFQYAGRQGGDGAYPWGDDWKPGHCASLESGRDETFPVGSFPDGAAGPFYDLCGSVWEWTSSKYTKFPGYKALSVEVGKGRGKERIEGLAGFDANYRVIVGGSFANQAVACRLTTRFGAERVQNTNALGFRPAASRMRGFDAANFVIEDDVDKQTLPFDFEFDPSGVITIQRWTSRPGDSNARRIPGYAVITGFDYCLFIPSKSVDAQSLKQLRELTLEDRYQHLGVLATTVPLMEPALEPGAYALAWRAAGKMPEEEKDEVVETPAEGDAEGEGGEIAPLVLKDVPGFDPTVDCFLVIDMQGKGLAAWPAPPMLYERMRPGRAEFREWVPPPPPPKPKRGEDPPPPPVPKDTLYFSCAIAGRKNTRGFVFPLELRVKPGIVDADWLTTH